MRFLITGGAGFIGGHLAEALLAAGERDAAVAALALALEWYPHSPRNRELQRRLDSLP